MALSVSAQRRVWQVTLGRYPDLSLKVRPKPSAFDPSPHDELSVAHSTGLADDEVWTIGARTLGAELGSRHGSESRMGRSTVIVR
jgi:hypothetical protein